ncbi:DUF192 domain-containing protein [Candidatus Woesearchaeota archaeon]|jgi:uncharacterized protein|nr:DUF192 domain-containing protein [Candidatus Woesearchaeota archaeon]MBT5273176.1 DUF192 domain-containing protein [Candidatus Woesearchaeota archaeon]MBT6041203.1 DUF192 domain-containing protein [Candidatus Woesearchaeota archaeon]MBT6337509.1 DUF192 domain-containing protein [Candidatus Woesearchaeota archaeon]MBT7927090.1 DUF192 domain-containing protein [Candidatus Woesearchaeota archaeon]
MIYNTTKNTQIVKDHNICKSWYSKLKGLMFSKKNSKNLIFVFDNEKKIGLHMWFVFYPIDVLLLDSDKKVVEIKERFRPFSWFNSKEKAKYVLELYSGTINDKKIEIGDRLEF